MAGSWRYSVCSVCMNPTRSVSVLTSDVCKKAFPQILRLIVTKRLFMVQSTCGGFAYLHMNANLLLIISWNSYMYHIDWVYCYFAAPCGCLSWCCRVIVVLLLNWSNCISCEHTVLSMLDDVINRLTPRRVCRCLISRWRFVRNVMQRQTQWSERQMLSRYAKPSRCAELSRYMSRCAGLSSCVGISGKLLCWPNQQRCSSVCERFWQAISGPGMCELLSFCFDGFALQCNDLSLFCCTMVLSMKTS